MAYSSYKITQLERTLQRIEQRLDTSYLRDDISNYLALEVQYSALSTELGKMKSGRKHY